MEALVRQVDHVFVPVDDPVPLFRVFTETLGFPVSWPVHDYGLFRSGGVTFGNCNLEFVTGSPDANPYFKTQLPSVVRGIAFEPAPDADWEAQLDARNLRHTGPVSHEGRGARGHEGHLWTTMFLGGLIEEEAVVFLCEYKADECLRGDDAREAMAASKGGVIGAERIEEITIGVQDTDKAMRRWQRLLDPVQPSEPGLWHLGDGPAIQVRESPINGVAGLTVKVRSLEGARKALMERKMLGPVRRHGMGLHYARTHGLDVWLVE
jgi:glyoxalase-like protein